MSNSQTHKVVGIDLGTTMSCMAGMVNGRLGIIDNRDGERITPSIVCFDKDGSVPVVGSNAILAATSAPTNFVYEVKRMFGKGFYDKDIQKSIPFWPFQVKEVKTKGDKAAEAATDNIGIAVCENGAEKIYAPIQVSACVLSYLLESAKQRLGIYPTYAVITVPAYFHDSAKQRTLDAARIAFSGKKDDNNNDLVVETTLLAEPTAAAMAYGSIMIENNQVRDGQEERILVFDLGGGTYDVSVLDFSYDKDSPVGIVKATDGDNYLGGADFDNVIVNMAKAKFAEMNPGADLDAGMTPEERKKSDLRLRQEAIKVKASLSTNLKVVFNLSCYRGSKDLVFEVSRTQFERASRGIFDKLLEKVKGVLLSCEGNIPVYTADGKLDVPEVIRGNPGVKDIESVIRRGKSTINRVVMVGGSSRIPKVKAILEEFFGENATTPASEKKVVSPLNPDEAIAYGAGYYANACKPESGSASDVNLLLIDLVPLNLNIETLGGVATKLIEANTAIPCRKEETFSTAADNQTSVEIVVTQGNRKISAENHLLGRFTLSGIPSAPRGVPQITVTFEVDKNNILCVYAKEQSSGVENKLTIDNVANKLSKDDIERMVKQAEEHSKQDAAFEAVVSARNTYETMIYQTQDKLESAGVNEETKTQINALIAEEENWLKTLDKSVEAEEVNKRMQEFTKTVAGLMGGASGSTGNPGAQSTGNPDVEEVN
ncbi:endoplasmic reticulum chaperone BiP [Pancytospora epiphaga]|nr:endoplasmic reticulum chaperone BiP [Pancytospora epiphaga]